ncbi:cell division protein SepF [Bacillus sp. RG28]|uniref:Cell division protein SepF n=1 Tax=Gottfriedia endophytica TaxID=2820819 RepID=A0A940NHM2_9BACI|nr:cell division protein SepF [Gottfriedia endophytica]MBP0725559.1 cell division protein SepF [Gottfriedia endophytica]
MPKQFTIFDTESQTQDFDSKKLIKARSVDVIAYVPNKAKQSNRSNEYELFEHYAYMIWKYYRSIIKGFSWAEALVKLKNAIDSNIPEKMRVSKQGIYPQNVVDYLGVNEL